MNSALRQTQFKIDTFPGEVFTGFTLDEDWNGWACPYFELNESKRILNIHKSNGRFAEYDEPKDIFIFADGEEIFTSVNVERIKLYPIGNSCWIWEEI